MVNEKQLSTVLSEFARTMITDFPIQKILDELVRRIVEVLPVTSAGVTLISGGDAPQYVAASDEWALRFERLQSALGQGPSLTVYPSGEVVTAADLRCDDRYPEFAAAAVAAGLIAVFTFPLRHGKGRLGALNLYRDSAGELDEHDMTVAQILADVVSAYLLNAKARDEARSNSERFLHGALHDPLTGLPNRRLLEERIEHAAQRAGRSHSTAAILFADLDRFKLVNDHYGHHVGDELLLAVSERLARLVRSGDTLARVSGDEFVFLCEDLHDPADVEILAHRIGETFAHPFVLSNHEFNVTASVGIAFAGPGEAISNELVVQADMAMYEIKRKGGAGHHIIDMRESLQTIDERNLEADLRAAAAGGSLDVAYQPIVRSGDGLVIGLEALLRWYHPQHGQVPAMSMVTLAEQSGLINDIGRWVLERSCQDRNLWMRDHPGFAFDLAVNVSARQLTHPDFTSTVSSVLTSTGMDPSALVLEVTENIFIGDSTSVAKVLSELKDSGVRIALDDFGSGYSSLNYLARLPIDVVKIDQSFIVDMVTESTSKAIVEAVTGLAHVLQLSVVAEGVETVEQRNQIEALGCEFAQGFYYARPMPSQAVSRYLGASVSPSVFLPGLDTLAGVG